MIIYEHNKVNHEPYLRITSDQENHYVKIKGSENEPTNEIMIPGDSTDLEFEEIYIESPQSELDNKYLINPQEGEDTDVV